MSQLIVLFPRQCRAARELLGIKADNLAALAKCGISTLRDFEREARETDYFIKHRIKYVLECLGAEFLNYPDGSFGVRSKFTGEGVIVTPDGRAEQDNHCGYEGCCGPAEGAI